MREEYEQEEGAPGRTNRCSSAEKRKGSKGRQKGYKSNSRITFLEFNLFLDNKHSLLDIMDFSLHLPAPMNIIIHIIRNTLHLLSCAPSLYFKQHLKPEETQLPSFTHRTFHIT